MRNPLRRKVKFVPYNVYVAMDETLKEYWADPEKFDREPPKRKWWRFWKRG